MEAVELHSLENTKENQSMNVQGFVQTQEQNPYLDAKAIANKAASGKILEARAVKTPKFNGIFLTVKIGSRKFAYPLSFDRFDIGAVVAQTGSAETDDWIGETIKFVCKKGESKKGKKVVFVNVLNPKAKKGKK